jgi:predicted NBD/HSP70 family sugar kinase
VASLDSTASPDVRRQNLSLALAAALWHGPLSQASIATLTGLAPNTVSRLVTDLKARNLLTELGQEARDGVGRRGTLVGVAGQSVGGLGLEVSTDRLAVSLVDLTGGIAFERQRRVNNRSRSVSRTLDDLARLGRQALDWAEAAGMRLAGVTVAAPGLVDEPGHLVFAPNLGWADVHLVAEISERLGNDRGLSIQADNEANLAAVAEYWHGPGRDWGDYVLVSGEVGVGAGIVIDGRLFRANCGFGGEFGHLPVVPDGPPCPCGSRGCLERVSGLPAILAAAGLDADPGQRDAAIKLLTAAAGSGDAAAIAALDQAGRWLGTALSSIINLLAPQTITLGGVFGPLADWLAPAIWSEIEERAFVARFYRPQLVVSELGAVGAVRGAGWTSLRRVCEDPTLVPVDRSTGLSRASSA